jgi:prophage DNA circulation protein
MCISGLKSLFQRGSELPELQAVVDGLSSAISARRQRSALQISMAQVVIALIRSEAPQLERAVSYALQPFSEMATNELNFALCEERLKDDLTDVIERYKVVSKKQAELNQAVADLQNAKSTLVQLQAQATSSDSQKHNVDLLKVKFQKSELVEKCKNLTRGLIDMKKKFLAFRLNRVRHGWQTYAGGLSDYGKKQEQLFHAVVSAFVDIRRLLHRETVDKVSNPFE